jgi:uncharacterized protein YdgA (DUF945 family)
MKKVVVFLIALLLVVAAVFLASGYWFGMQAERQYNTALLKCSQWGYARCTNESYNRGLFSSKARTVIELREPGAGTPEQGNSASTSFALTHEIQHGPVLFGKSADDRSQLKTAAAAMETSVALTPETQKLLQENVGISFDPSSIKVYTTVHFGGGVDSQLIVPAFQQAVQKEGGESVKWEKLVADSTCSGEFKSCKASLSEPGFEVISQSTRVIMNNLTLACDFREGISGLIFGDAAWEIAKIEYTNTEAKDLKHFLLTGMSMKTSTKESGDNISSSLGIRFDRSEADDAEYGPGNLSLEFRNLDAASVAKLRQALRDMQNQNSQQPDVQPDQMLFARYMEILPGLLKKSPEIELSELSLKSSKGDFLGKAKIAFDGSKSALVQNPLMILNAVAIHAEFSVTEGLLEGIMGTRFEQEVAEEREQTDEAPYEEAELKALGTEKAREQLQGLVAQQILIHEGGKYKATASYLNGNTKRTAFADCRAFQMNPYEDGDNGKPFEMIGFPSLGV